MSQGWRGIVVGVLSIQATWLAGCGSTQTATLPVPTQSLAADIAREESPRLARLQRPEAPGLPALGVPSSAPSTIVPPPPLTPLGGAKQTSMIAPRPNKINVRAWVNGRPIFDDEVMQNIPQRAIQQVVGYPEAQRHEKLAELFNQVLDQIIEQEVVYQEAIRKLEKIPRQLDKLKTLAEEDFDKQVNRIRSLPGKVSEEEIKEFQRQMRRQAERSFISMEYMRSRIFPQLKIAFQDVKDYYDTHLNEFTKVETVKWQDVFLAVGPKYPTLAQAKRFAEDLIAQCRTSDDFTKLIPYDDGDSKFRGGDGLGSRRGEIRPAELEEHLFKLRDGEIGPIVEFSTGVHIIRLVSRDPGGLVPLNETVQNQIRGRLRNQLADREYKRIARELRSRAVIEIVRDAP